jgi:hypothetical protein
MILTASLTFFCFHTYAHTQTSFFLLTLDSAVFPQCSFILKGFREGLLAIHDRHAAFTGPSDELFQKRGNLLDKVKASFKRLLY